jgi:MFS family permease
MALTAAILGWMFDGFEMGLFPIVGRPALAELTGLADNGTWYAAIIAAFLVGAAAGGVLFGWLGDRIGRVKAMIWSVLAYTIFSGLCGFVRSPWELAGLRFLASLGMGGEWALGVALVMEIWPGASRPLLAGMIGAAANVGYVIVALLGYGLTHVVGSLAEAMSWLGCSEATVTYLLGPERPGAERPGWRLLMILGASPALLTFFIRIFVPESERWKHAVTGVAKPSVREIFAPGLRRHTLLGTALGSIALLGTWGSVQWLSPWAGQLAGSDPRAAYVAQMWSASGAVIGTIFAALLAERLNRRQAYFLLALASLAACGYLFWCPLWSEVRYDLHFLVLVGVVGCVTASFYGWLPLYLPELFPTRVRATGQGFAFNAGRLVAAAGTLVAGQLLVAFDKDYAAMCRVISLVYVLGLVVIWFCPETKGKPLPE